MDRCFDCHRHVVGSRWRFSLVFEDVEQGVRVKASFVDRQFSKPRLCQRLGAFQAACVHELEAAGRAIHRYSPVPAIVPQSLWKEYEQSLDQARLEREHSWSGYRHNATNERRRLNGKYRRQRALIAALPISGADKKSLSQQLSIRKAIASRALTQQLTRQRKIIQKTMHPGTWRHFVASRANDGDARAVRLLHREARGRDRSEEGREL